MNFETKKIDGATFQINATAPYAKLEETYEHVLDEFAKSAEIKGFRKGLAPIAEVEKVLDKGKLYGEVINHILPEVYAQALKETKIKPIISPRIKIKQFDYEQKKDLILEFTVCEKPEVQLPINYLSKPSQSSEPSKTDATKEEKEAQALGKLLATSEVAVPQILIDEEVERSMAKLIEQTQKLGLTVDQYLAALKKTPESLRAEYSQKAREALKQEFVLMAVAEKESIKATDKDVEEMIAKAPEEKVREELRKPEHRSYIESVIIKRKVLEAISL